MTAFTLRFPEMFLMKNERVTFKTLQHFLADLGFTTISGSGGYFVNDHAATGCRLLYPAYHEGDPSLRTI